MLGGLAQVQLATPEHTDPAEPAPRLTSHTLHSQASMRCLAPIPETLTLELRPKCLYLRALQDPLFRDRLPPCSLTPWGRDFMPDTVLMHEPQLLLPHDLKCLWWEQPRRRPRTFLMAVWGSRASLGFLLGGESLL